MQKLSQTEAADGYGRQLLKFTNTTGYRRTRSVPLLGYNPIIWNPRDLQAVTWMGPDVNHFTQEAGMHHYSL